jgi:hypothetical protein
MATGLLVIAEVACFLGHFAPRRRYCTFLSGVSFIISGKYYFSKKKKDIFRLQNIISTNLFEGSKRFTASTRFGCVCVGFYG